MSTPIADGVWPTMITPFRTTGEVDYAALEQLVEWYIAQGVQGLFAVCQSSEMFFLTLEERAEIARFVREKASGRVQVVASGHISEELGGQIEELKRMAATGVDAVVLVSNRLAKADETDEAWIANAQKLLDAIPDIPFGVYECPYPYKRLLSPAMLKWCAATGRFRFLKDTSCDVRQIRAKLDAVKGSDLKLFNANSSTLLESLKLGAAGFSGVMANFHPDLYVRLTGQWRQAPELVERLQSFLTVASLIELQVYPVNAKYHLSRLGLPVNTDCRVKDASAFGGNHRLEVEHLERLSRTVRELLFHSDQQAVH